MSTTGGSPLPDPQKVAADRKATALALLVSVATVVLVSVILLVRDPMFFWVCDYQLWFSGLFEEVARAWSHGEWPILNQGTWAIPSIAGEYQCGTFSIFINLCVVLVWSLPLGLAGKAAALSIVHLAVLAAGSALLARQRGLTAASSVFVAIIASLNGWMINWAATDWVFALSAFAWVPWSWWALETAIANPASRLRWLLPALFIYLTIAAGSPFTVLMLAVISAWLILRTLSETRTIHSILPILVGWCAGLGLSAPAWLMLIEYHQFSTRGTWPNMLQWSWIVPWRAWLGLALPSYSTEWREWSGQLAPHFCIEMAGGLVPLAAAVAFYARHRIEFLQRFKWELLLVAVAVALVSLPSVGSFRWSFRSMPLVHLSLALLGAGCLERISVRRVAVTAICIATLGSIAAMISGHHASTAYVGIQLALLVAWLLAARVLRPSWAPWTPAAFAAAHLLASYCSLSTLQSVSRHEFRQNLVDPAPLERDRLYLSVHSFSDILRGINIPGWGSILRPCNTALFANLHFLNGYSAFSVRGIPSFFEAHGSLQEQTVDALLGPECFELLDMLGVDGLIFGPDYLDRTARLGLEWQLTYASDEGSVFHRDPRRAAPAKTLRRIDTRPGERLARPELNVVHNGRQQVIVDVRPQPSVTDGESSIVIPSLDPSRPAAVAFCRPFLPGYRATLNGKSMPVLAYQDYVPVVDLPPGASGLLILSYRPPSLLIGAAASGVTLLTMLAVGCWSGVRHNRSKRTAA